MRFGGPLLVGLFAGFASAGFIDNPTISTTADAVGIGVLAALAASFAFGSWE